MASSPPPRRSTTLKLAHSDDGLTVTGPGGSAFTLAPEDAHPLARAQHNQQVTHGLLRDIMESTRQTVSAYEYPTRLIAALGEAIRQLPVPWLQEFAYAGMLNVLLELDSGGDASGEPSKAPLP